MAEPPLTWYRSAPVTPSRAWRTWRFATRREHTLDALACLALSALCFSQTSKETLFRADRDFYNQPLGAPTLLAFILNVVAVAAVGFVGAQASRRVRHRVVRRVAAVLAATMLLVALNFARITYDALGRWVETLGPPGLLVLAAAIVAASFRWPRPMLRVIRGSALALSPVAIVTLAHALWMFLELAGGPMWRLVEPTPFKTAPPSLRRVVWVLFTALDHGVTFESRPPGLELPELDRLRRESVFADAARPPAGTAEVSMPALITGRPVVAVAPLSPNDLELTMADGKTARWSTHPNVFARARVFGYDTAVVGWHVPYPRVLGSALGLAEWRPSVAYEQTRGHTVGQALRNQWGSLLPPVHVRRLAIARFAELGDVGLRTATNGRFGLVLLHLPLPQPPGIYDPATGHITPWNFTGAEAEYLDNLALVDRLVGELRRGLERARLDDRTWLVVSSDRWRRTSDPRVPFLVRPPVGGRAAHIDDRFNTLGTHDLVLAILRGSVADTDGVVRWLTRYRSAPPKDYTSLGRPIY
ncbi:MAG: alkaline phosphatase family protein [Candidatus Rokubacteria bacterium]|nr:alkaline phosphatase family protein [Candidatus Rokubacteria bacterium]